MKAVLNRMDFRNQIKDKEWQILGIILVGILGFFTLFLGEDTFIVPHDQFDFSLLAYMMRASHFGMDTFEEIMNGLPKEGLQTETLGLLIFYVFFKPVTAYISSIIFIMFIAFVGMYFLLSNLNVRTWVSFLIAILFVSLPFYSVYGLTIMGLPLFIYLGLVWKKESTDHAVYIIICINAIIYGVFSSLVLCGYAVLACLVMLWFSLKIQKLARWLRIRLILLTSVLLLTYCFVNFDLIFQMIGQEGFTSHRSEYVLKPEVFSFKDIVDFWKEGQYHAVSNHYYLLLFLIFVVIIYIVKKRAKILFENKKIVYLANMTIGALISTFMIAAFYGCFHSRLGIELRSCLPEGLKTFQFDRVYWLYPLIWYVGAGLAVELLLVLSSGKWRRVYVCIILAIAFLTFHKSASSNILYLNIKNVIAEKTHTQGYNGLPTFASFFSEDVFKDIKKDIGKPQNMYRVVSIGLYPTVPLYNGFYCLDAYSNNYPLEYKHEFYKVIQGELEKDEDLKTYFCDWGNRCYAFSHEIGRNYMVSKESELNIQDLCFNLEELKKLGCEYIFSAVEIEDEEQYGLQCTGSYSSDSSYYRIWVYCL